MSPRTMMVASMLCTCILIPTVSKAGQLRAEPTKVEQENQLVNDSTKSSESSKDESNKAKAESHKVVPMSEEARASFLKKRCVGAVIGRFGSWLSLMYACGEYWRLTSDDKDAFNKVLNSVYPSKLYKPTQAEFFEALARQLNTNVEYDPKRDYWVFNPPHLPLPYSIELADGWQEHVRGYEVGYVPKIAPVGMDIYIFGRYSNVDDDTVKKVREEVALWCSKMVDKNSSAKDMKPATVDGAEALYFETDKLKQPGCVWRQWAFMKNGQMFVIVSAIDKSNESTLYPDVRKMVESFKAGPESCPVK